ncbi:hypothetical protein G1H11_11135 [Phytoactinopolyspora alkaliphila]|uniref:Uncharacterized protein n=1 Tax=Phytoactinopolyspora alkaliphila TaxID=1783498 RepID=A0A6N9YLM7_9ACTN|nr:hypothetical protein [Phytoactinopolyspora alkaliphila]
MQNDSDVERWLDSLDPATTPARDGARMRRIAAARQNMADAEQELRDAVAEARAAGDTWSMIGIALGTTRQAAFQRFGKHVGE